MEQKDEKRFVAHLLYAPTRAAGTFRGRPIEIIEDLIPLHDITITARLSRKIKFARLVPEGDEIEFSQKDGAVSFTVPEFTGHQMVELAYG